MSKKKYKNNKKQSSSHIISTNMGQAKYLFIVESPSKCAKIEHFLGEDYCCIASKGHIRSIDGLNSIDTALTFSLFLSADIFAVAYILNYC